MIKPSVATLMTMLCFSLAACGGGGARTIVQTNGTCGKQLTDLQTALNTGAMTQSEYNSAREEAIRHCDHDDH